MIPRGPAPHGDEHPEREPVDKPFGTAIVHQALHGYDQGHRLLAVSTTVPPEAERAMLELSDASGPNPPMEFGGCLTGYPVPTTEWYAFARTWPAPEMHRPGCVWTHTLLIHVADLAHMRHLSRLTAWFRRPTSRASDASAFRVALVVPLAAGEEVPDRTPVGSIGNTRELLVALYGPAATQDTPVALVTSRPELYAQTVVALWDQQWPRLRRAFSFCTAAAAPRRLSEQPLTLQVLPPSGIRVWPRGVAAPIIVQGDLTPGKVGDGEPHSAPAGETSTAESAHASIRSTASGTSVDPVLSSRQTVAAHAEWVEALLTDLSGAADGNEISGNRPRSHESIDGLPESRGLRRLRDFFAHYAVDVSSPPRASLRVLAQLHSLLSRLAVAASTREIELWGDEEELLPLSDLIRVILGMVAEAFPNPKDAARLKRAIFGGPAKTAVMDVAGLEPAMLAVLATSPRARGTLAKGDLRLRARARRLWQSHSDRSARALLDAIHGRMTPFGEEVLTGLAEGMPESEVLEIAAEFPGTLYHVVRARPLVAASPALWCTAPALRREAVTALETLRRVPKDATSLEESGGELAIARRIIEALLDAALNEAGARNTDGADTAAGVARALGPVAVFAFLDQVDYAHLISPVAAGWERALADGAAECRGWLVDHLAKPAGEWRAPALAALALALDPHDARPEDSDPSSAWACLAFDVAEGPGRLRLPLALRLDVSAFALAAAFDEQTWARATTAAKTVALLFEPVHAAALAGGLSSRAWSRLESRAPAVHWSREWDHAERLREALIRAFARPNWPAALFVRALGDGMALAFTMLHCAQNEGGRHLVRVARDAIRAGHIDASPRQREAFEAAAKRNPLESLFDLFGPLFG